MELQLSFRGYERDSIHEPLLKWPGGKRALLKEIIPLFPKSFNHYYEPFIGGGAAFFALRPNKAILADNNSDLINCYEQVRDNPDKVIAHLRDMPNTERDYYTIRESIPQDKAAQAARFIYLCTLSFNGIYRVNLKGVFNVPYGYKRHLKPCHTERIIAASEALSFADLRIGDFESSLADARDGDLVYLDPPYTVAHSNNGFLKYNAKLFSWNDQERLAAVATALVERGCRVLVSNADHESIRALYTGFQLQAISRPSIIAASGVYRRQITECIFYNRE